MKNQAQFKSELESLINKLSIDNDTNTPDFILAEMIVDFVNNIAIKIKQRDEWFGADHEG